MILSVMVKIKDGYSGDCEAGPTGSIFPITSACPASRRGICFLRGDGRMTEHGLTLAERFWRGVSKEAISQINTGRTWSWLEEKEEVPQR